MKRRWFSLLGLVLVLTLLVLAVPKAPAGATVVDSMRIFLLLEEPDVSGECDHQGHEDEIDILSSSYGIEHRPAGSSRRNALDIGEVVLTKYLDKSSPKLHEACCEYTKFGSAVLTFVRMAGDSEQEFLKMTMEDVVVTSLTQSVGPRDEQMLEQLSLRFERIVIEYTEYDDQGKPLGVVSTTWPPDDE